MANIFNILAPPIKKKLIQGKKRYFLYIKREEVLPTYYSMFPKEDKFSGQNIPLMFRFDAYYSQQPLIIIKTSIMVKQTELFDDICSKDFLVRAIFSSSDHFSIHICDN